MGYAVRTHRYRYVEWRDWESKQVVARELYEHLKDPGETRNIIDNPHWQKQVGWLKRLLHGKPNRFPANRN